MKEHGPSADSHQHDTTALNTLFSTMIIGDDEVSN